jgi:hypothetical protein
MMWKFEDVMMWKFEDVEMWKCEDVAALTVARPPFTVYRLPRVALLPPAALFEL